MANANETPFELLELSRLAAEFGLAHVMAGLDESIMAALRTRIADMDRFEPGVPNDGRLERVAIIGFIFSIRANNAAAVELFVRVGVDPSLVCYPMFMDGDDSALGTIPYFWQARSPDVVERVLALGADPDRSYRDYIGSLIRPEEDEDNDDFEPDETNPDCYTTIPVDALCYFFLRGTPEALMSALPYSRRPDRLLALADAYPTIGFQREQKMAAVAHLRRMGALFQECAVAGKKWARRREHAYVAVFIGATPIPYDARNRVVDYLCD